MKKLLILTVFFCNSVCAEAQIFEQFTDSGIGNSYSTGAFVGSDGLGWNYVKARGNQQTTANGNKAISLNKAADACIFSDTIDDGIKFVSFQYEQELTANCDASVFVNDSCVAVLTTNGEVDVTNYFSAQIANAPENAVLRIQQNSSSSGQLTIDDIYIEFARTPFICNTVTITDTIVSATFSHKLSTCNVIGDNGVVRSSNILGNSVFVELNEQLCGVFSLSFSEIYDTANTQFPDTVVTLTFYGKPELNSIVITEIMADPSPSIGLPECEFVEIFNRGDCAVLCSDVTLVIGSNEYALPPKVIESQEYICIVSTKEKQLFPDTSKIIFLNAFPSISNGGQTISLLCNDEIISSVHFSDQWYADDFKKDGGWSLEKIDSENFSETPDNWRAACNRRGGTPCMENSVSHRNGDIVQPTIRSLQIVADTILAVTFAENIEAKQLQENMKIEPHVHIINSKNDGFSLSNYLIFTDKPFIQQTEYTLNVQEATDFAGNSFSESNYAFAVTDSVLEKGTIIFNEILFNPKSGGSDFVELYNNSDSYFDLLQLYLSNGQSFEKVSESFRLFPPHTYAVVSPDAESYQFDSQCNNAIFVQASLPSLPDDEGTILVLNRWEDVIDSVSYSKHWHSSYLTDIEGVSLEKIEFSLPSEIGSSWCSAAASVGYSTPGCENSQALNLQQTPKIVLESEVVTPNSDGQDDEMIIHIGNSERGMQCSATICAPSGRQILQLANNQLLGTNDFIRWNCTDNNGRLVPAGIYIVQVELLSEGKKVFRKKLACTVLRE